MSLRKIIPKSIKLLIKTILNRVGLARLVSLIFKNRLELEFQKEYVRKFKENKDVFLEHWKKYRYLDEVDKICQIKNNTKILDVGCGISSGLIFVKGEKYGIDPLADEYKKLYSYENDIRIKKGFGEQIPFPEKFFDLVFCTNVLDHVRNPEKTISEIYRVLKPDGYFMFSVEIFNRRINRDLAHPHLFFKEDIYLLLKNRFKIIFEKESPMMEIESKKDEDKDKLILIESANHTKEMVLLLKK